MLVCAGAFALMVFDWPQFVAPTVQWPCLLNQGGLRPRVGGEPQLWGDFPEYCDGKCVQKWVILPALVGRIIVVSA